MVETRSNAPVRSPFEGHATGNRPNAAGQIGVQLTAGMLPSFTLISTWISGLPGLLDALTAVFGAHLPQQIGKTARTEFGLLMKSGPEEFLLVGDDHGDRTTLLRATVGADASAAGANIDAAATMAMPHAAGARPTRFRMAGFAGALLTSEASARRFARPLIGASVCDADTCRDT